MRKLAFLLGLAIAIFVSAQVVSATQIIDDTLQVNSLKVGQQGVGGVTYFNGTIVNETTDNTTGADMPVTFGDNVRIDGRVYRGATAGSGDGQPFQINDDLDVAGTITLSGSSSDIIIGEFQLYDYLSLNNELNGLQSDNIITNNTSALTNYNSIAILTNMLRCLTVAAEIYPSYIPTSIWIDCWNYNIASEVMPTAAGSVEIQAEKK